MLNICCVMRMWLRWRFSLFFVVFWGGVRARSYLKLRQCAFSPRHICRFLWHLQQVIKWRFTNGFNPIYSASFCASEEATYRQRSIRLTHNEKDLLDVFKIFSQIIWGFFVCLLEKHHFGGNLSRKWFYLCSKELYEHYLVVEMYSIYLKVS